MKWSGSPPAKALEGVHPGWARMKGLSDPKAPSLASSLPVALMGLGLGAAIQLPALTSAQWGHCEDDGAAQQGGPWARRSLQGSILSGSSLQGLGWGGG